MPESYSGLIRKLTRPKFDPEGSDYDYETALRNRMTPSPIDQHWPSRVATEGPDEGQILKGTGHPTFWKTREGEEAANYEIFKSPANGKYYSRMRRGRGM